MKEAESNIHEGNLKSIIGNKLVRTCPEGKEHAHLLAADTKVTCHGKSCKAADLKTGMKIRVTTKKGDENVASRVEATEKNDACANSHEGKVVSVTNDMLKTTCSEGKQHCHIVGKDAKVTCDGQASKAADLKAGTQVRVTTHKDDKTMATAVESGKHLSATSRKA